MHYLLIFILTLFTATATAAISPQQQYQNFTDYGNYIIHLGEVELNPEQDLPEVNALISEYAPKPECSVIIQKNDKGELITARNMELYLSERPVFLSVATGGKYRTFGVTYIHDELFPNYKELLASGKIADDIKKIIPYFSADSFNEAGLYIEANLRNANEALFNSGLNPDKPQALETSICLLVAQNAKNVPEALEFLQNSYNYQSLDGSESGDYWTIAYSIADSEGNFGIIEIANNEINYLPNAAINANFFLSPKWAEIDPVPQGKSRADYIKAFIPEVQSHSILLDYLKPLYASHALTDVPYAHYNGGKPLFLQADGSPTYDWRGDILESLLFDENGELVPTDELQLVTPAALRFALTDENFPKVQKYLMQKYNKLMPKVLAFREGREDAARAVPVIGYTVYSMGVNTTTKEAEVRFWERDDLRYYHRW